MADQVYTGETVTVYFEMWDGEESPSKPASRPNAAWITAPTEVSVVVKKPNATSITKTLTGGGVTGTRDGEWRARFDTDGGAGYYNVIWTGLTADGSKAVSTSRVKAKAQP